MLGCGSRSGPCVHCRRATATPFGTTYHDACGQGGTGRDHVEAKAQKKTAGGDEREGMSEQMTDVTGRWRGGRLAGRLRAWVRSRPARENLGFIANSFVQSRRGPRLVLSMCQLDEATFLEWEALHQGPADIPAPVGPQQHFSVEMQLAPYLSTYVVRLISEGGSELKLGRACLPNLARGAMRKSIATWGWGLFNTFNR